MLDEPTSGLDPLMQKEVLTLIREARDAGATVFFSSHIMSEVEAIAERVGIIRQGVVVEVAQTDAITNRALRRVWLRFKEPVNGGALASVPGVTILSQEDELTLSLQVAGEVDAFVKALGAFAISDLEILRPSLEEIFLAYYESN
jgi:ABC-2 type transport system ATP-binding protein